MIIQNHVPHRRYYGEEPAEIATEAAERYWRSGLVEPGERPHVDAPEWASPVSLDDLKQLVAIARELMPDVGVQVPPNLSDWWPELVAAGATDLGGLSVERRPHLAGAPVSVAASGAQAARAAMASR